MGGPVAVALSRLELVQPRATCFFILAVAAVGLPIFFVNTPRGIAFERRVYWGCMAASMVCVFVAAYPYVRDGLGLAGLAAFIMTFRAYQSTSYIKIGGKIRAFNSFDAAGPGNRQAARAIAGPDSYAGLTTATKSWWVLTFIAAAVALVGAMYADHFVGPTAVVTGIGLIVVMAVGYGVRDGCSGKPVARGQRIQFVAISALSAGVFPAVYLASYALSKRRARR